MLASSQNPDRVSNILRSSVVTMRPMGMVRWVDAAPVVTWGTVCGCCLDDGHATAPSGWVLLVGLALVSA